MNPSLAQLEKLVTEIGRSLLDLRESGGKDGKWVGDQFKANADLHAQEAYFKGLVEILPGSRVVSEEDPSSHSGGSGSYWLIDPVDGTRSYAEGYKGWVTQAAWMVDGRPHLAAVSAPDFSLLYSAEKSRGAFLNGKKLQVTGSGAETEARALTLIDNSPTPHGIAKRVFDKLKFSGYIESGSISLKMLRVADSTASLFIKDVPIRDWDLAAPLLILEESGGIVTDVNGKPIRFGVNPDLKHHGLIATGDVVVFQAVQALLGNRQDPSFPTV